MEDNIEEVKDSPIVDMPVNSQEQPPVATGGIDWKAAAQDMTYADTPSDPTELSNSDLLVELMSKVLSVSASVKVVEEKLDEATELFKNGQKEMHRLIAEAQTARFSSDNKKTRKPSIKSYTKEDEEIWTLMAAEFNATTGQAARIFSQTCNMEVLKGFGHYPGDHCPSKKNTGAFDKIDGDLQAAAGNDDLRVPTFGEYFRIGLNLLESLKVDISDAIKDHINAMEDSQVDNPEESLDDEVSHEGESTRGSAENNENEVGELH